MKYLVLLIGDGAEKPWSEQTEDEQAAAMAKFGEFGAACEARDGVELLAGEALSDSRDATGMRTTAGRVALTDGPYAEVIEGMGGFYLVESPDLYVLVELLQLLPQMRTGRFASDPCVEQLRARTVQVARGAGIAYGDGEELGTTPVTVESVPGALRVCLPANAP